MTALLIGTALAVASLCYVLYPLLRSTPLAGMPGRPPRVDATVEASGYAVDALRELEFDRQTGKISDADYAPLKARYTEQAVAVMRSGTDTAANRSENPRSVCPRCGPRPEAGAEFCSDCGARLSA
jgi:hypothetical protein